MLVQEHVAEVLRERIPEDWEEGLQEDEPENEEVAEAESEEEENDTQHVENTLRAISEGSPPRDTLSPTFHSLDQSSSSDEG